MGLKWTKIFYTEPPETIDPQRLEEDLREATPLLIDVRVAPPTELFYDGSNFTGLPSITIFEGSPLISLAIRKKLVDKQITPVGEVELEGVIILGITDYRNPESSGSPERQR